VSEADLQTIVLDNEAEFASLREAVDILLTSALQCSDELDHHPHPLG
jgi:hypothetical protein